MNLLKHFKIDRDVLYPQVDSSSNLVSSSSNRFYWIRISLFEKKLHKIVAYLVKNSEKWAKTTKEPKITLFTGSILDFMTLASL